MKKIVSEEILCEMMQIVNKSGFLKKEQVVYFSKKNNTNYKLFCNLIKTKKIPYLDKNLFNVLNAYDIFEYNKKTISLEKFNLLGDWKFDVFKNSKIKAEFVCKECQKTSKIDLRKLINRVYYKMAPICPGCICGVTSKNSDWLKNTSSAQRICKNRQDYKEKHSNIMKRYWTIEKNKENLSLKMREKWKTKDYRQNVENGYLSKYGVKNAMQTSEVLNKSAKNSFKIKKYVFPSGKVVKIQGYENFALNYLLDIYNESDIVVENKEIEKVIGKIFYFDAQGKQRRYFPDILIISENKIIEVKSEWTFNKHIVKNRCKQSRCEQLNFKFQFMIFDEKGNEIKI